MALKLYTDAACTVEFSGTWQLIHNTDLSDNPQTRALYWAEVEEDTGSNGTLKYEAKSNPGVDNIFITIVDANVGAGHEASEITLAQTELDLDTATAGADLIIGTSMLSGQTNAEPVWIRVVNAVTTVSNSTELSSAHNELLKTSTV